MISRPAIALLIPAYNAAAYLPRLLKSAAAQTDPFDQIWVYDDCSTDDTAAVARAFGANVLAGNVNAGCSAGKNALARHVQTDFLHFHDADDELLPNFVSLARGWIERGAPDVVLFAYEYRQDGSNELLSTRVFDSAGLSLDPRSYAIREQINPFCGLYRRSAILASGGYDEDPAVLYNEDVAFHIRLAFAGLTFDAEPEISIINYRRSGSMSAANARKCAEAHLAVMRKTLAHSDAAFYLQEIATRLWLVAGVLGSHLAWAAADEAVGLASSLAPAPRSAGAAWYRAASRVMPRGALRAREFAIRALKPGLRSA